MLQSLTLSGFGSGSQVSACNPEQQDEQKPSQRHLQSHFRRDTSVPIPPEAALGAAQALALRAELARAPFSASSALLALSHFISPGLDSISYSN